MINSSTVNYLLEFRRRAIRVLIIYGVLFLVSFLAANPLYNWLVNPLVAALPVNHSLIAINIASSVLTPFRLAGNIAFLIIVPLIINQLWRFISPALYLREQHILRLICLASPLLFFLGMLFGYWVILPFMFAFFVHALPATVSLQPDMAYTLQFILSMLYIFGICFQVPLLILVLIKAQIVSLKQLLIFRAYYIVAAFIIGMLLTPPDVFSQLLVALPLCVLYELGILGARLFLLAKN